ncbi:MAG: hypothetical protein GX044_11875 [Firmicutes bacterium]|nr:hypothetical protein [Bacillota bacterium]
MDAVAGTRQLKAALPKLSLLHSGNSLFSYGYSGGARSFSEARSGSIRLCSQS